MNLALSIGRVVVPVASVSRGARHILRQVKFVVMLVRVLQGERPIVCKEMAEDLVLREERQ